MELKDIDLGELGRSLFAKLLRATASDGSLDDMMEYCSKKKIKYTDDSFPPSKKSLISDWNDDADDIQEKVDEWSRFTWIRASDIEELNDDEGQLAVFADDVTPGDIKQGLLGDCYFLSVLSALAEVPDRITKLFLTDRLNEYGLYAIKMQKGGETREVVMDDYFPCQDGEPCFSKANGNELWVLILEKAWAKLHGSYERIEAGHAHNVMADLTGAPSFDIDMEEEGEGLFERLCVAEQKNYMMAASAGSTDASADVLEDLGLVAAHSYGLLKAIEVTDAFGDKVRLVQLRNPWGDFEWNGDWGDSSELWTEDIKKQCDYSDEAGLFYMSYDDMLHYFSRIQICHINDDYHYSFMKASQCRQEVDLQYTLMRLVVTNAGEHTISVSQTDERCFNRHSEYEYSNCRIIICKIEKDADAIEGLEIKYLKGSSGYDRETHNSFDNLEKGEYFVYVEMDWMETTEDLEFCVTCYGASKTFFLRDEKSLYTKGDYLRKAYASKATQMLEGVTQVDYTAKGAPDIKKYKAFQDEGYGFIYIVNGSKDATFKEVVKYTNFQGLKLLKPQLGSSYDIEVGPGKTKMILIWCDPDGYGMGSSSNTQVVFGGKKLKELCKEQGKKNARPDPETGEEKDIWQYSYQHGDGVCYLYVNNTKNETLEEEIEFKLVGLEIDGAPGKTSVEFEIGPGQEKFIKLKSISTPWKIQTGISYGIYD